MKRFMQFRRLRRQTRCAERPAAGKDKPTKGAGKRGLPGYWSARFFVSVGVLLCVVPVHAQDESAVLYPGTYQAEAGAVERPGVSWVVTPAGAESGGAVEADVLTFATYGTDVSIRIRRGIALSSPQDNPDYTAVLTSPLETDAYIELCESFSGYCAPSTFAAPGDDGWVMLRIVHSITPERHSFRLGTLFTNVQLDSITVLDRTFENTFPYIAAIGITIGMTLFVVISALRERWRR
ncbi:MAG: hypothetical protein K8I30_00470 [Anaerolineae bacterium]|nr:hypothetical protein [Anaerolineae bacterium]